MSIKKLGEGQGIWEAGNHSKQRNLQRQKAMSGTVCEKLAKLYEAMELTTSFKKGVGET